MLPAMSSITSITAKRKSSYALRAVGAMPTINLSDGPQQGYFEHAYQVQARLNLDGPYLPVCTVYLPVCIWHDEDWPRNDGWRALLNGYEIDVYLVFPECGGRPIGQATYNQMIQDGSK